MHLQTNTQERNLSKDLRSLLLTIIGVMGLAFLISLKQAHPVFVYIGLVGFSIYIISIAGSAALDFYAKIRDLFQK